MKAISLAAPLVSLLGLVCPRDIHAFPVSFGAGANQFAIDFVTIGQPGNPADTTGAPNPAGSVGYVYNIGQYEVSRDMIEKANAAGGLQIRLADFSVPPPVTINGDLKNVGASGMGWNEMARFVNWLNSSRGFPAAYKFATQPGDPNYNPVENILLWEPGDVGLDPANPFRNRLARFFLPSTDEWFKAAYYDPASQTYFDYATGSNTPPTIVLEGTDPGTAVYGRNTGVQTLGDHRRVGGPSPFGTFGQNGSLIEWLESEFDGVNNDPAGLRVARGGSQTSTITSTSNTLLASSQASRAIDLPARLLGFRIVSVPEPSSLLLALACTAFVAIHRRRCVRERAT